MIKNNDIASIEKSLQNLPRDKIHKLLLLHLSEFSDFFLNIASYGGEVEKTLGSRVAAKTLAPLSFMKLNGANVLAATRDPNVFSTSPP